MPAPGPWMLTVVAALAVADIAVSIWALWWIVLDLRRAS